MSQKTYKESKHIAKEMFTIKYNNIQKPALKKEYPKKAEFPTLVDFALDVVAKNFEYYPELPGLGEHYREKVIAKASKTLNIKHTATYITDESYWKDACFAKWKLNNLEAHGCSWKQAYLEKIVEEMIRKFKDPDQLPELLGTLKAARHYVFNLRVPGLNYPIDFKLIMAALPVLNNLSITFGPLNTGMNYNRQMYGMKMNDAFKLAEGVKNSLNLIVLALPGNLIDDDLMKVLMNGISYNRSLIELNLSHNRIGNHGARRIAKFIMKNEILLNVDLSDNEIGYDGSRYLAQALKMNKTIQKLSLKLNNIKDKGGAKFFKDLKDNESLIELNMAANTMGPMSAEKLADYLADLKCNLQVVDVSSNHMTGVAYSVLKAALTKNTSLKEFNVKMNDMLPAQENELKEIIIKHNLETKKIPFVSQTLYERVRADSFEEVGQGEGSPTKSQQSKGNSPKK